MIKDCISGYLYNELFIEINEGKYTAFQCMALVHYCSPKYY